MLPQGDATHVTTNVTWLMHGPAPFMSRVMQVFMNVDNMIGKDFEIVSPTSKGSPRNNRTFEASTTEGASDAGQSLSVLQRQLRSGVQVL